MINFFKQYTPFYKNYKLQIFYAFIGIILVASATAGTAYAIQPLLDDIFINKNVTVIYRFNLHFFRKCHLSRCS